MNSSIETIPLINLSLAFIPVLLTIGILFKWSLNSTNALYAVSRMLVQLLLIGYFLTYIFKSDSAGIIIVILAVMVFVSSWIALGTIPDIRLHMYKYALLAICVGGGATLALVTQGVLMLDPWYSPQSMIPIAGMIFANTMNSVSLAAERLNAETGRDVPYDEARSIAMQSAMIPVINSLFAVGLVSLPGMMTRQILAGAPPLQAVSYQIVVMFMIAAAVAGGAMLVVVLAGRHFMGADAVLRLDRLRSS